MLKDNDFRNRISPIQGVMQYLCQFQFVQKIDDLFYLCAQYNTLQVLYGDIQQVRYLPIVC